MPPGVLPLLAGLALVGLGVQFDLDILRSFGVALFVGGILLFLFSRFTSA